VGMTKQGNASLTVKDTKDIQGARVERSFHNAQEEASQKQTLEVVGKSGQTTDNCPESHASCHIVGWSATGKQHVGGHLAKDVADKED